jgi:hypothetical protein
MIPSVGRIVHFVLPSNSPRPGQHVAAIITDLHLSAPSGEAAENTAVDLFILNPSKIVPPTFNASNVVQDSVAMAHGTWHQPETAPPTPAAKSTPASAFVPPAAKPASQTIVEPARVAAGSGTHQ